MIGGALIGREFIGGDVPQMVSNPYAFPTYAGVKFALVNLTPRITDTGNADNNPVPVPAITYDLLYDLGTQGRTGSAWVQWLKPQIDAAYFTGFNTVRFIFDPSVRVGDVTHHGRATWRGALTNAQLLDIIDMIATYTATLGMYFYPAGMEPQGIGSGSGYVSPFPLTPAQTLQFVDEFIAGVSNPLYTNIIGCDVLQEFDRSDYGVANLPTIMARARAAMNKPITLTCSISALSSWATAVPLAIAAGVDCLDLHSYLSTDAVYFNAVTPNNIHLPVICAETGIGANGGYFNYTLDPEQNVVHPFASESRARHYQNVLSAFSHRYDVQLTGDWAIADEWLAPQDNQRWGIWLAAQDGNFAFTTYHPEMFNVIATLHKQPVSNTVEHVLDLTGANTTIAAWSAGTSFMLEWGLHDYANQFSRDTHRVKRLNGVLGPGVVNYNDLPAFNQYIRFDFDASQAVAAGGEIDWAWSVRHTGDNPFALDPTKFYAAFVTSKPGDPNDGLVSIYKVDGGFTLLASTIAHAPFDLTHSYRGKFEALGTRPTKLTFTLTDLTTATDLTVLSVTDGSANLQGRGSVGMPAQIGTTYATNVAYSSTDDTGPWMVAPLLGVPTTTTQPLSWSVPQGGTAPFYYVVQYAPQTAKGLLTGPWISRPSTTGLSDVVTGLTPGTRYAYRIQVTDSAAPWS